MTRFWKEASSVITGAKVPKDGTAFPACRVNILIKNAVNTNKKIKTELNFKVLALRRSIKNSLLPDSYVFPGGNISVADSSKEWLFLFDQYGLGKLKLLPLQGNTVNSVYLKAKERTKY